jgi:2-polyprenyl-3-methyl-5-hydroxy-6-metoxy-1,4-benzoquinol methylase
VSIEQKVSTHFEADAHRFDAIYESDKSPFMRFVDNVWRGVVRRRLDLALACLEPLQGKSALDIGCGSGRFCLAYAQRGATRVVGIDFAPAMIELANQYARQLEVADRCEFIVGTVPQDVPPGPYDVCSAIGFFDYVANPVPILTQMRELTRSKMIMSFPKRREWRIPLRRLRFRLSGCPLFLYSQGQIQKRLAQAGINRYDCITLDRDYIIVAYGE